MESAGADELGPLTTRLARSFMTTWSAAIASGDIFIPPIPQTRALIFSMARRAAIAFAGLGGDDIYVVNHSGDTVTEAWARASTPSLRR